MTSISVSNGAKSVQTVVNAKHTYRCQTAGNSTRAGDSFQSTINLCQKPEEEMTPGKVEKTGTKPEESNSPYTQKSSGKERVKDDGMDQMKKQKTFTDKELDEVKEAVDEIISQVAEELGVGEEEVKAALESLGIQVFDLGNTNQMSVLFAEILGMEDSMQIVTDGDLFASLTNLTQVVEEVMQSLQEELQIPMEDVCRQLEGQLQEVASYEQIPDEHPVLQETTDDVAYGEKDTAAETIVLQETEQNVSGTTEHPTERKLPEEDAGQEEPVMKEESEAEESGKDRITGKLSNSTDAPIVQENANDSEKENSNSHEEKHSLNQNANLFSIFDNAGQTSPVEGSGTQRFSYSMVNDIMEQIGDYIKTNVTADVKQMEIQLTPANLGQVHINLASKNGVITAQIAAENETVKNAIELQVVQLKERLESQGVKIEAVEVTVATHEFERNLDENRENREAKEEVKKASSKKWKLSEMEEGLLEGESLSEAEQVELDMMKLTGNQLNYMV